MSTTSARTPVPSGGDRRRFTVLWMVSGRERRSARMTEVEAQRLVERLTREKAEAVRVDESDMPSYVRFRPT
jgi:hypothetical protein